MTGSTNQFIHFEPTNTLLKIHPQNYNNSPPISKSWIRACYLAYLPGLNRPQFLQSWKATRWRRVFRVDTTLDAKWSAIVQVYSWSKTKTLGSDFLENSGLVVPNFLWVSSPGLHTPPREKCVSFSHKYQGKVEFWMRVKLLHIKQLNTAFKTATSRSRFFSIFSSNSRWEMYSSVNRTRSVRSGGKYYSIPHKKISEIQTGIFDRMERAL